MIELFPAYRGEVLSVSLVTDSFLRTHFPEVDAPSSYRSADAYLAQCPKSKRPKNARKFLINWFRREKHTTLKSAEAWREKEETLRRERNVGL